MASRVQEQIDAMKSIASVDGDSLGNVIAKAILLPVTTLFASLSALIAAGIDVPIKTFDAFGTGLGGLAEALLSGPADMLQAGANEAAASIQSGVWSQFGPLSFAVMVGGVLAGAYLFAKYTDIPSTGNFMAFLPFDVPVLGNDEEGD